MRKRFISIFVITLLVLTLLTGCYNRTPAVNHSPNGNVNQGNGGIIHNSPAATHRPTTGTNNNTTNYGTTNTRTNTGTTGTHNNTTNYGTTGMHGTTGTQGATTNYGATGTHTTTSPSAVPHGATGTTHGNTTVR